VDARFEVNAKTAPAVAEICRRLDGIPLAIELAAARAKLLTVEEIQARLDDRFRLLTGGSKTALPRHQTLRATIQWSYDQLTEEEQRLFRVLAVFAGGWTMEAATRVAWEHADEFALLELLGRLVNKSLVTTDRVEDGTSRYGMLETVRQYAQERLNESGDGDPARTRHLDFMVGLAEEAEPMLLGPDRGVWLARLAREQENLLSAHAWCDRAAGGAEKGLRLFGPVRNYWPNRGLLDLGYRVTREALGRRGADARTPARALALFGAVFLAYHRGLYGEARVLLEESLSIARALEDRRGVVRALAFLGSVAIAQGDRTGARAHSEEALAGARELGDTRTLAAALNALAEVHRLEGALDRAVPLYEEALALVRERGEVENITTALLNLAMVVIQRGDLGPARVRLAEAATLADESGSRNSGQVVLDVAAALASAHGDHARAARMWGASETARETMGLQRDPVDGAFVMAWIARARESCGESGFAAAEAGGRALSYEEAMAGARTWLEPQTGRPAPPGA
jgi:non-specific serine/threonine protein kinase